MYPYNYHHNATGKQKNAAQKENLSTRENGDASLAELAKDEKFLEILDLALTETGEMEQRYNRLSNAYPLLSAAPALKTMMLDEQKGKKRIQEIFFSVMGENMESPEIKNPTQNNEEINAEKYLEQTLLKELDLSNFYRNLFLAISVPELRDLIFELFTDKQNHIGGLNYVYSKYFPKN